MMNAFTRATDALTAVLPFRGQRNKQPRISPLACVDPRANIAEDVEIGPFCVVGPDVTLGTGNRLIAHAVITGHTTIGRDNVFYPNCVIGAPPQDLKYKGECTRLEIGNSNQIREAVTIHVGTEKGGGITRLGDSNLLMINAHLGHDAQFGSRCIISNNVMVAGHVVCGDNVVMLGAAGIHHFVTIGDFAFLAGACRIHHDVPPFVKVADDDEIRGLNSIGLKRAGFDEADIEALEEATRQLFYARSKSFSQALCEFDMFNGLNPYVKRMVEFLRRRDLGKHGRYLEGLRAR
ncbi:MAG: acyl-ACP--UDP-N-acetylglucosamine O-acyltransferase [Tepidisphaeraceae bacterium]